MLMQCSSVLRSLLHVCMHVLTHAPMDCTRCVRLLCACSGYVMTLSGTSAADVGIVLSEVHEASNPYMPLLYLCLLIVLGEIVWKLGWFYGRKAAPLLQAKWRAYHAAAARDSSSVNRAVELPPSYSAATSAVECNSVKIHIRPPSRQSSQ